MPLPLRSRSVAFALEEATSNSRLASRHQRYHVDRHVTAAIEVRARSASVKYDEDEYPQFTSSLVEPHTASQRCALDLSSERSRRHSGVDSPRQQQALFCENVSPHSPNVTCRWLVKDHSNTREATADYAPTESWERRTLGVQTSGCAYYVRCPTPPRSRSRDCAADATLWRAVPGPPNPLLQPPLTPTQVRPPSTALQLLPLDESHTPSRAQQRLAQFMTDVSRTAMLQAGHHSSRDNDSSEGELPSLDDLLDGRVQLCPRAIPREAGSEDDQGRKKRGQQQQQKDGKHRSVVAVASTFLDTTRGADASSLGNVDDVAGNPAALALRLYGQWAPPPQPSVTVALRPQLHAVLHAPGVFGSDAFYDPFHALRWWEASCEDVLRSGNAASAPPDCDGRQRYVDCFGNVACGAAMMHPMRRFMVELFTERQLAADDVAVRGIDATLAANIRDVWVLERLLLKTHRPRRTRPLSSVYNVVYPKEAHVSFLPTHFPPAEAQQQEGEEEAQQQKEKKPRKSKETAELEVEPTVEVQVFR
ncbi:hypothetical protein DQ04_02851010 [Trypanosoma grayi]|uniref:hypothetical protein n=1 Tax=Trypanosoma grayi TaxID=71804 RepID=UPI0004F426C6|nr:hypothetical protein DQ04_02851010 [Trypanosoma grayi]KEG11210.1 hypothetical protein DQ04_02851010 [Trypanosoma grayi]